MNRERLELMSTMLGELIAGQWKTCLASATIEGLQVSDDDVDFDLWFWVVAGGKDCGFSACAVGHAMLDERFYALGLGMVGKEPFYRWNGVGYTGWDAVEKFFEISGDTSSSLFSNSYYYDSQTGDIYDRVTPDMVKWRVDKLLASDEISFNHLIDESISEIRELHK